MPLIDSRIVAQTFALRREVCKPQLRGPQPLLPDSQAYGSVIRDPRGAWRMWYLAPPGYCEHFAESDDGLAWRRPELDLVSDAVRAQAAGRNAFMSHGQIDAHGRALVEIKGPEGFSVLDAEVTPHPAARMRYTALYLARFRRGEAGVNGLCLAHSQDGIHWLADERNPVIPGWRDTANQLLYDERLGKYLWYGRPEACVARATRANRLIARAESGDLVHWSPERTVLDTDEADAPALELVNEAAMALGKGADDPAAVAALWARITEGAVIDQRSPLVRGRGRQWYGICVFPCADLYLGLGWMYDIPSGAMWIELLHSYDGVDWRREAVREPFIPSLHGATCCTMSTPPVAVGDELWLYYSNQDRNHHARVKPGVTRGIRLRTLRRDRWVAYRAAEAAGELLTQVIRRPQRLTVNAAVEEDGFLTCEVLDAAGEPIAGFDHEACAPLRGDALDLEPVWSGNRRVGDVLADHVRLRFLLRRGRLFALGC